MSALSFGSVPRASIFVSYSTDDTEIAERMLRHVERDGIQCFFAPRDIAPQHYSTGVRNSTMAPATNPIHPQISRTKLLAAKDDAIRKTRDVFQEGE